MVASPLPVCDRIHRGNATVATIADTVDTGRAGMLPGHPRGLATLAGTELWDRISFHGMQALLVLYMVDQLLRPGSVETIGCLIFAAGVAWLAAGTLVAGDGKVPMLWAVGFHLITNFGWLYFTPTAVALVARAAPASVAGSMIGVYTLSVFLGSTISGRLGALYEVWSPERFWLLHAGIVAAGGLVFVAFGRALSRQLLAPAAQRAR